MRRISRIALASTLGMVWAVGCRGPEDDDDSDQSGTGGTALRVDDPPAAAGSSGAPPEQDACPAFEGLETRTCNSDSRVAKAQPVNMLLVIDKSGSMADDSTYAGVSKWSAMTQAVSSALEAVVQAASTAKSLSVGLMLYPDQAVPEDCGVEPCCEVSPTPVNVEVGPAAVQVPSIVNVLGSTAPTGLTPTAEALAEAYTYYTAGSGAALEGHKYVLLATDGGPNCNSALTCEAAECTLNLDGACTGADSCCATGMGAMWCVDHSATVEQITRLRAADVKTIVVGIPGTEAYESWLNAFAVAGDASAPPDSGASYYKVSASGGVPLLERTLKSITTNLVNSCWIQLTEDPPLHDTYLVNVAINCKLVPQSTPGDEGAAGAGELTENWRVDESVSPVAIEILGTYCDAVKAGVDRVDIVVNCPIYK